MIQGFFKRYVGSPIISLLKEGLTPELLAVSMASGFIIGTFPLVGTTTAICIMISILFRMNLLVIQLGNWLIYPIQLLLIVPFMIMGEHLFGSPSTLSPSHILTLLQTDLWTTLHLFSRIILHAALAWMICAPFAFAAIYVALKSLFSFLHTRMV
jgi:uncharacterized protein (DUF2062 family)